MKKRAAGKANVAQRKRSAPRTPVAGFLDPYFDAMTPKRRKRESRPVRPLSLSLTSPAQASSADSSTRTTPRASRQHVPEGEVELVPIDEVAAVEELYAALLAYKDDEVFNSLTGLESVDPRDLNQTERARLCGGYVGIGERQVYRYREMVIAGHSLMPERGRGRKPEVVNDASNAWLKEWAAERKYEFTLDEAADAMKAKFGFGSTASIWRIMLLYKWRCCRQTTTRLKSNESKMVHGSRDQGRATDHRK